MHQFIIYVKKQMHNRAMRHIEQHDIYGLITWSYVYFSSQPLATHRWPALLIAEWTLNAFVGLNKFTKMNSMGSSIVVYVVRPALLDIILYSCETKFNKFHLFQLF